MKLNTIVRKVASFCFEKGDRIVMHPNSGWEYLFTSKKTYEVLAVNRGNYNTVTVIADDGWVTEIGSTYCCAA